MVHDHCHMYQKQTRGVAPASNPASNGSTGGSWRCGATGEGFRTQRGMDANSVLCTIYATDWINGKSRSTSTW